jgi:hypothetical protein
MRTTFFALVLLSSLVPACGGDDDDVDSDEEARRAYLGLDLSIEKSLDLGMQGFREADSANIADQEGVGDETGTLVVGGQVDQGSSDNKGLRLDIAMVEYSDGLVVIDVDEDGEENDDDDLELDITYDTDAADLPFIELSLRDYTSNGTFTGTMMGTYTMTGDLEGTVTLMLTMSGDLMGSSAEDVSRVVGSTTVTGTATNDDGGTYDVDLTI